MGLMWNTIDSWQGTAYDMLMAVASRVTQVTVVAAMAAAAAAAKAGGRGPSTIIHRTAGS